MWKVKKSYKDTLRRQHQDKARIHVTSGKVRDGEVLRRLVRVAMKGVRVRRARMAYDSIFFLSQSGINCDCEILLRGVWGVRQGCVGAEGAWA